jgi:hypothetical protein
MSLVPSWHIFSRAPMVMMVARSNAGTSILMRLWLRDRIEGRMHAGIPVNGYEGALCPR